MIKRIKELWQKDRDYVTRYLLVYGCSIVIHILLGIEFALMGRPVMAGLNLLGLALFGSLLHSFARIRIGGYELTLLYLDVAVPMSIYLVYLGPSTGFYLYSVLVIPVTFYLSCQELPRKRALFGSACVTATTLVLVLASMAFGPLRPMTQTQSAMVLNVNIILCLVTLAVYMMHFIRRSLITRERLTYQAEFDTLTGLRNRHGIVQEVDSIVNDLYCVVMCDIDNFKIFNDTYGHRAGDEVLVKIGAILRANQMPGDLVCRWGGEEFLMVIRASIPGARETVQRIRDTLAETYVEVEGQKLYVTMTFGIADSTEAEDFERIASIADSNLYLGKRSGRNRVISRLDDGRRGDPDLPYDEQLNMAGLTDPIFTAIAATSDNTFIYICNVDTNVSRWSANAVELFGLPNEYMEAADKIWMEHVHPEDRELYADDVAAVFSGKKKFHDVTYRARCKDGRYIWVVCRGLITPGDMTHPALFAGTMTILGDDR